MSKGKSIDPEIELQLRDLYQKGLSAAQAYSSLGKNPKFAYRLCDPRTVQRRWAEYGPADQGEPFSLMDCEDDDAELLTRLIGEVVQHTEGSRWPTRQVAKFMVRVARAAPGLSAYKIFSIASEYVRLNRSGDEPARHALDWYIVCRPWEGGESEKRYAHYVISGKCQRPYYVGGFQLIYSKEDFPDE